MTKPACIMQAGFFDWLTVTLFPAREKRFLVYGSMRTAKFAASKSAKYSASFRPTRI
jgi:hypothetical protein